LHEQEFYSEPMRYFDLARCSMLWEQNKFRQIERQYPLLIEDGHYRPQQLSI
jgi:hypothetical protein